MKRIWLAHHNKIMNILAIGSPVLAGVLSGGVFTLPVLITAVSTLAAKMAQTPVPAPVPVHVQDALKAATEQ